MALTSSEAKEIEVMIRKEIKSFMNHNTIKQFEDHLMDRIQSEINCSIGCNTQVNCIQASAEIRNVKGSSSSIDES